MQCLSLGLQSFVRSLAARFFTWGWKKNWLWAGGECFWLHKFSQQRFWINTQCCLLLCPDLLQKMGWLLWAHTLCIFFPKPFFDKSYDYVANVFLIASVYTASHQWDQWSCRVPSTVSVNAGCKVMLPSCLRFSTHAWPHKRLLAAVGWVHPFSSSHSVCANRLQGGWVALGGWVELEGVETSIPGFQHPALSCWVKPGDRI